MESARAEFKPSPLNQPFDQVKIDADVFNREINVDRTNT
jgi:hypothetical protein